MTDTRKPGLARLIISLLAQKGAMGEEAIATSLEHTPRDVKKRLYDLEKQSKIVNNGDGTYSVAEGVLADSFPVEEESDDGDRDEEKGEKAPVPLKEVKGKTLDSRGVFIELLKTVGVKPDSIIPTLANTYFAGDVDDLKWLEDCLMKTGRGFVTPNQFRSIRLNWSKTRGLPFNAAEFKDEDEPSTSPKVKAPGKGGTVDPGIGWKIEKDKNGEWVARPGGPIEDYEVALDRAERRQALQQYTGSGGEGDDEQPKIKSGAKAQPSLTDQLLSTVLTKMVENMDGGKNRGESDEVKLLREEVRRMKEDKQEQRFERIEGMITNIANRDPLAEFEDIQERRKKLGLVAAPVVTDASPAVQLIKNTGDKLDKQVDKITGLLERQMLLREGDYKPEETRTLQDREAKAEQLSQVISTRERSRELRKKLFDL